MNFAISHLRTNLWRTLLQVTNSEEGLSTKHVARCMPAVVGNMETLDCLTAGTSKQSAGNWLKEHSAPFNESKTHRPNYPEPSCLADHIDCVCLDDLCRLTSENQSMEDTFASDKFRRSSEHQAFSSLHARSCRKHRDS